MGIDAKIFVRNKGPALSKRQITALAAQMASVIGHERFFITRGEHGHHALTLCQTAGEARAEYAEPYHLDPNVPDDRFIYQQDGDPVVSEPGEQFIRAHLWSRYYGPGYERGDWPTIRAVLEFLEFNIPRAEVWYGGDSSGVCAEPFDAAKRAAMTRHFLTLGHEPYRSAFDRGAQRETCAFCADRPMNNSGGGGSKAFWSCDGCGLKRITDGDKRRDLGDQEDFFGAKADGPNSD